MVLIGLSLKEIVFRNITSRCIAIIVESSLSRIKSRLNAIMLFQKTSVLSKDRIKIPLIVKSIDFDIF